MHPLEVEDCDLHFTEKEIEPQEVKHVAGGSRGRNLGSRVGLSELSLYPLSKIQLDLSKKSFRALSQILRPGLCKVRKYLNGCPLSTYSHGLALLGAGLGSGGGREGGFSGRFSFLWEHILMFLENRTPFKSP